MKILVIGGTGLIGSKLVSRLGEQGHEAQCFEFVPSMADAAASYFGAELGERTLLPGAGAVLAGTRYRNWPGRTASGR
jgi:nucleoside-diphosphate-sugar epimerase